MDKSISSVSCFATIIHKPVIFDSIYQDYSVAIVETKDNRWQIQVWSSYRGMVLLDYPDASYRLSNSLINPHDYLELRSKVSKVCNQLRDYRCYVSQKDLEKHDSMINYLNLFADYLRYNDRGLL